MGIAQRMMQAWSSAQGCMMPSFTPYSKATTKQSTTSPRLAKPTHMISTMPNLIRVVQVIWYPTSQQQSIIQRLVTAT